MSKTIRLLIPAGGSEGDHEIRFRLDYEHAMSRYGIGVLVDRGGNLLDGAAFRRWRDAMGARLETDDLDAARAALGLPPGEPLGPPDTPPAGDTVAARLRQLMPRGVQVQVVGQTRIPDTSVRNYVSGRTVPDVVTLGKICRALGVSLAAFDGCES